MHIAALWVMEVNSSVVNKTVDGALEQTCTVPWASRGTFRNLIHPMSKCKWMPGTEIQKGRLSKSVGEKEVYILHQLLPSLIHHGFLWPHR